MDGACKRYFVIESFQNIFLQADIYFHYKRNSRGSKELQNYTTANVVCHRSDPKTEIRLLSSFQRASLVWVRKNDEAILKHVHRARIPRTQVTSL